MGPSQVADERAPTQRATTAALAVDLLERVETLAARALEETWRAEPSYASLVSPDDFRRDATLGFRATLRAFAELPPDESSRLVGGVGRRRAEQGIPVEAFVRTCHREFRIVWRAMLDAASETGDPGVRADLACDVERMWQIGASSIEAITATYFSSLTDRAREQYLMRQHLLEQLLSGEDLEGVELAEAGAALGFPRGVEFRVVVADARESPLDAVAELERLIGSHGWHWVWQIRETRVRGVVAIPVVERDQVAPAFSRLDGDVSLGFSLIYVEIRNTPSALLQATSALNALGGNHGVSWFDEHLIEALVLSDEQISGRLVERTLGGLLDLPDPKRSVLLETLSVYVATSSIDDAARQLFCHRNTVHYRLREFEEITGRSWRRAPELAELSLALTAERLLRARRPGKPTSESA